MIAAIRDHQRKSRGFREALRSEGWWVVPAGAPADVLLTDHELDVPQYREAIKAYEAKGTRIVVYPHGANPYPATWDLEEPYPVDACLVIGTGYRDMLQACGYPNPIHVVGWSMCEQQPFRIKVPRRVLFAPQHPLGSGYLHPDLQETNRRVYKTIRGWGLDVTVRHIGTLEMNGLEEEDGVAYETGRLALELGGIDDHDLIVARDTFLSLAVARGKAAITFRQTMESDPQVPGEPLRNAPNCEKYAHIHRFPYDIEDPDAFERAWRHEPKDWRARFIGDQMDAHALSELLKQICRVPTAA